MRVRTRILGATVLSVVAGSVAGGCGGGEDVKQAAAGAPAAAAVLPSADTTPAAAGTTTAPARKASGAATTQRVDDAEAAQSFALPEGTKLTEKPPTPGAAKAAVKRKRAAATDETEDNFISPGAPSDEQIAAELRQMEAVQKQQEKASGGVGGKLTLERDGTVSVGAGVPEVVARVVEGANAIAKYPYVYGGGHGSFVDTAYDCSGSLSYALAAGGLLDTTKVSGEFANSGAPGPGKWITIYANAGHTFMVVGGIRYDTSGRGGPLGTRWQTATRSIAGFKVRHPPGL
jgi:hypothetical protein